MRPNPQTGLVTCTENIFNGKLHLFKVEKSLSYVSKKWNSYIAGNGTFKYNIEKIKNSFVSGNRTF